MPFQYGNPANPRAHYEGTAEEIVRDCPEIDVFVAGLGTGGTLMGSSRRLKEHRPEIEIVACEPLQGDPVSGLRSLDDGFVPPILDVARLDRKLLVSNRDSIVMTRRLATEEGIFAGVSSGAVIHVCARIAAQDDARDRRRDRLRRRLEVPVGRHLDRRRRRRRGRRSTTASSGEKDADGRLFRAAMRASGPWPGPPADRRTGFAGAGAGKSVLAATSRLPGLTGGRSSLG